MPPPHFDPDTAMGGSLDRFPSTRPSLVGALATRERAIDAIIEIYWKPAYKYIRRVWNQSNEDAKDLTQGFFASLLERQLVDRFDPTRASFRTYLRTCIDGFVQNQRTSATRLKRGGDVPVLSLDFDAAEHELASATTAPSPEELFHREWQRQVVTLAVDDLRRRCEAEDRVLTFRIFEQYDLAGGTRPSYQDLAAEHGIPYTQVTNYLAWARRELRRAISARLEPVTASGPELDREVLSVFRP